MPDEKKAVLLKWNDSVGMWEMKNPIDGSHIYRMEDCQFFRWLYPDLVKGELNYYKVKPHVKITANTNLAVRNS